MLTFPERLWCFRNFASKKVRMSSTADTTSQPSQVRKRQLPLSYVGVAPFSCCDSLSAMADNVSDCRRVSGSGRKFHAPECSGSLPASDYECLLDFDQSKPRIGARWRIDRLLSGTGCGAWQSATLATPNSSDFLGRCIEFRWRSAGLRVSRNSWPYRLRNNPVS